MITKRISVVLCTKNEEKRIEDSLRSIVANEPGEIIVVDGGSKDRTVEIARKYTDIVIVTSNSSLMRDRQVGIDAAKNEYIAMIDSDQILGKGDLESLLNDLLTYRFDIVQSQIISYKNMNYWNAAEEQSFELTHNIPGPKKMIGVSPAIFRKSVFEKVRFDDNITKTIEDTDFMYRASKIPGITFGIGKTRIRQFHYGSYKDFLEKFKWYGKGDGEFCVKHPNRAPSMFFHLLIRYPVVYSLKAVLKGKYLAVPFFIMQGWVRFYGMMEAIIRLKFRPYT